MTPQILAWIASVKLYNRIPTGHVLEVGSRDLNGSPRTVLADASSWLGVDLEAGAGVDLVGDAEDLVELVQGKVFDTVVCCEMLEHCVRPWIVVAAMRALVAVGGHLWVSAPTTGFGQHRHPVDCFRYLEDAYTLWIYQGWELLHLGQVIDVAGGPGLVAVGRKPARPVAAA